MFQGVGTPVHSVLQSLSSIKMKFKEQNTEIVDGQKSNCQFWLHKSQPYIYIEYGYCTS